MNGKALIGGFAVLAVVVSTTLMVKYDDWFVTPKLIEAKRGYVVQQMRDPATVQFRGERLTQGGWLCGELNGKNGYGAYTGFKRFVSFGYDDAWIEGSGYAGKPDARSTTQIIEDLDEKIAAIKKIKAVREKVPGTEALAKESMDALVQEELFNQRWQKHCS